LQIHRGVTRTVVVVGDWAVKFPSLRANGLGIKGHIWSFCRGVIANQAEEEWSGVEGVNPVVWSPLKTGLLNIYRRAELIEVPRRSDGQPRPGGQFCRPNHRA